MATEVDTWGRPVNQPEEPKKSVAIDRARTVGNPCDWYRSMELRWILLRDLQGGTVAMQRAGTRWLPRETDEKDAAYSARLLRSVLFGAYTDTVEKLTGKPFSKAVTVQGILPGVLANLPANIDRNHMGLTEFAREVFRTAAVYGLCHVLVDYPRVPEDWSLAEDRRYKIGPYFVLISPENLIGWTSGKDENGREILTSVRILETGTETLGDGITEASVDRVRVIEPGKWQLWQRTKFKPWVLIDSGEFTFPGIPLVTCYFQRSGLMTADPPLEDLAWLNLAHWQSMSDQRNILRFARFGLLFAKGFSNKEVEDGLSIGPSRLIHTTNAEADLKYVEHTGAAIGAGENDLTRLEERMEVLGMQPIMRQSGDVKATGQAIAESRSQSELHSWIRSEESALRQAFEMAATWIKAELPDNFKVDIFSEFSLLMGASSETDQLLKARIAGELSRETYLAEIKRRGLLSETVDVSEEMDRVGQGDMPIPVSGSLEG